MAEVRFEAYWSKTRGGAGGGYVERATGVGIQRTEELTAALREWGAGALAAGGRALERVAEEILTASKRVVPVDTGNLRASGHVQPHVIEGRSATVVLGYGGPAGVGNQGETNQKSVGYALPVHERFDLVHSNGMPKYLEAPVLAFAPRIEKMLADHLRREAVR